MREGIETRNRARGARAVFRLAAWAVVFISDKGRIGFRQEERGIFFCDIPEFFVNSIAKSEDLE